MDDIPIDYHNTEIWQQHVALMQQAIAMADQARPVVAVDAVFGSESYGAELARYFSAACICLDTARLLYPVSSTQIRNNPVENWQFLSSYAQAWFCLRVVIVGAESTGKTTLSKALSTYFQHKGLAWAKTRWVAEYGREYTYQKLAVATALAATSHHVPPALQELEWTSNEFVYIAQTQMELENQAAMDSSALVIADTDAFATAIWHERYVGRRHAAIEAMTTEFSPHRLYILTDTSSVPFEQDGIRDGEHIRDWMQQRFIERLQQCELNWAQVSGDQQQMLEQAIALIEKNLTQVWRFSPKWQDKQKP
jgi:NadR type nicotinamide-nucleotide adenylyltransferase